MDLNACLDESGNLLSKAELGAKHLTIDLAIQEDGATVLRISQTGAELTKILTDTPEVAIQAARNLLAAYLPKPRPGSRP